MPKKNRHQVSLKHKIALFAVYFVLFFTLSAMVDYYAYDLISPWIFTLFSLFAAVWATIMHLKSKQKSKADELAHDLEEII